MDEARAVLRRLERIEALEREGAGGALLLAELRELVRETAAWAERERDPRARAAAVALADAERAVRPGETGAAVSARTERRRAIQLRVPVADSTGDTRCGDFSPTGRSSSS